MYFILRAIHILSGVIWAGFVFFLLGVVEPTVESMGADGGKFMSAMGRQGRFTRIIAVVAILTPLSGLIMYAFATDGFDPAIMFSPPFLGLTIGALAGLVAFIFGIAYQMRNNMKMSRLAEAIQAAGGPPSSAQMAEVAAIGAKLSFGSRVMAILLVIAILGMASVGAIGVE